jgi:hypothetical protein
LIIFKGRFDGVGQHDLRDFHSKDLVLGLVDPRFLNILEWLVLYFFAIPLAAWVH